MLLEYLWRRAKVVMRRNHALQNEKAGILEECRPFEGAAQRRAAPGRGVRSAHGPLRCNGWSDLRFGFHPRPACCGLEAQRSTNSEGAGVFLQGVPLASAHFHFIEFGDKGQVVIDAVKQPDTAGFKVGSV